MSVVVERIKVLLAMSQVLPRRVRMSRVDPGRGYIRRDVLEWGEGSDVANGDAHLLWLSTLKDEEQQPSSTPLQAVRTWRDQNPPSDIAFIADTIVWVTSRHVVFIGITAIYISEPPETHPDASDFESLSYPARIVSDPRPRGVVSS
jgi:hypothetical protein